MSSEDHTPSSEAPEDHGCPENRIEECDRRFDAIEAALLGEAVTAPVESGDVTQYITILFWEHERCEGKRPHMIDRRLYDKLHEKLDETIDTPPDSTEIDIWVDSGGGIPHIAYKLLLDLRSRCRKLRAVIPDFAKSAATLLILGMDEIYMAAPAELGPLDVQVAHPLREEITVSALDVSGSIEYLGRLAVSLTAEGGPELLKWTGLSRVDILREILPFAAKIVEPAIAQLDPHLVHRARSQLRITREYAKRALASRNVSKDDELGQNKIEELCNHLVTNYPSHGFVISRAEAKAFGLPIRELEEYHAASLVNAIYTKYSKEHQDVCRVIKAVGEGEETDGPEEASAAQPGGGDEDMGIDGQDGAEGEEA